MCLIRVEKMEKKKEKIIIKFQSIYLCMSIIIKMNFVLVAKKVVGTVWCDKNILWCLDLRTKYCKATNLQSLFCNKEKILIMSDCSSYHFLLPFESTCLHRLWFTFFSCIRIFLLWSPLHLAVQWHIVCQRIRQRIVCS